MSCETCADPADGQGLERLAVDAGGHALLRCPECGTLHELVPEERIPARELTPWPGPVRYALLATLIAVVGTGLVVVLYDKGVVPIAGPFVLLVLLPILIPLQRRGVRRRQERLTRRLREQLDALGPALARERALPPHARPSRASDQVLTSAGAQASSAREQLDAGQQDAGTRTVLDLARAAKASWPRRAPLTKAVSAASGTAHTLRRLLR